MEKIAPYYKAVAGFLVPTLTFLAASLLGDSDGGTTITAYEWLTAIITGLIAGGVVFAVPNKDPLAQHQAESVQPPVAGDGDPFGERGVYDSPGILIAIACIVVIVCGIIWLLGR